MTLLIRPAAHMPHDPAPLDPPPAARHSPAALARWLRGELRAAAAAGRDWRAVVDALRPHNQAVWRGWDAPRREQFLRHARWLWECHRHRMAPEIAARIQALLERGDLRLLRGRVQSLAQSSEGLRVVWRDRDGRAETLEVARVLNCTGPASDYARVDLPLVANLRAAGWLTPDPLGMGVRTAENGQLLDRDGHPVDGLWTLGPLRKGDLWESTAIPEIRDQAARLIERLTSTD